MSTVRSRALAVTMSSPTAEFYREEIVRHLRCLRTTQDSAVPHAAAVLDQAARCLLQAVDRLAGNAQAPRLMSRILRELDVLSGLSAARGDESVH